MTETQPKPTCTAVITRRRVERQCANRPLKGKVHCYQHDVEYTLTRNRRKTAALQEQAMKDSFTLWGITADVPTPEPKPSGWVRFRNAVSRLLSGTAQA